MLKGKRFEKRIVDGFIVLDKPAGMTSNGALQRVKRLLQAKKAGFVGTLDPFATGMLPICLGRATKQVEALHEFPKTYIATVRFGEATSTGDREGEIIEERPVPQLTLMLMEEAMKGFVGKIMQIPPMFSALKKDGQPLYKLARAGVEVERPPREVEIYHLECLSMIPTECVFKVICGKGVYVRVLAEDLARQLGTCGHLVALHRSECAHFKPEELVSLESLASLEGELAALDQYLLQR